MEELCYRFPLMAQKIMNNVNDQTLINFKEAGRKNADFFGKERFYWIRIIQRYNCLIGDLHEVWKQVVRKTPVEITRELAVAVYQFPQTIFRLHRRENLSRETISPLDFIQKIEKQWHPLFIGATCGSVNLCYHITQKVGVQGTTLSRMCGKISPLAFAAFAMRDLKVFKFLLEKSEDKNPILRTHSNWTLLHDLAAKGHLEMCRLIVREVEDKSPCDVDGSTPYHISAYFGHKEVCRLLMEYHIDKNPKNHAGETPLLFATVNKHLEVCRQLMEMCVDNNHLNDCVRIPLHVAAFLGHVEVVELFIASVGDKNLRDYEEGGKTPLLSAIEGGNLNVCKLLIEEYKVDVNLSDNYGMTPLHLASKLGQLEICRFLCKFVQNSNTVDNNGKTPLDLAISEQKWEIVFSDLFW